MSNMQSANFALTPCEVQARRKPEGTLIVLRPKSGHSWSTQDNHSRAGTDRELLIDLKASQLPPRRWVASIQAHIDFAQANNATTKAILEPTLAAAGEVCPICLQGFNDSLSQKCVSTSCGHGFHEPCCRTWLSEHASCPVCRTELESTKRRRRLDSLPLFALYI